MIPELKQGPSGRAAPQTAAISLLVPALVPVLVLGLLSCDGGKKPAARKSRPRPAVRTAVAEVKTLVERLELTGTVEPTRLARMASPVEGPVVACAVREGDRVRPGQLLARIGRAKGDDAAAASARVELSRQQLEYSRVEKLVTSGALPGEQLDSARVKVSEAKARLARATEKLGDYRVTAPWSGVVSTVHVAVGDFVAARAPLVTLFDPASLVLRFAVPERHAARVRQGAPLSVALDAFAGRTSSARVSRVYPEINRKTHTRTVEANIAGDALLAPGMFARLHLSLAEARGATTVPTEALVQRGAGGQPVVFVIARDGRAEQRRVSTGIEAGGLVQVRAGVKPGERVAVAGHGRLQGGVKVRLAGAKGGKPGRTHKPGGERGDSRGAAAGAGAGRATNKGGSAPGEPGQRP